MVALLNYHNFQQHKYETEYWFYCASCVWHTFDKFEKLITINCFGILLSEVLVNYFWEYIFSIVWRIVLISQNASAWIVHLLMLFLLSFVTFLVFFIEKKILTFFIRIFLWGFIYFCLSLMVREVLAHDQPFHNAWLMKLWYYLPCRVIYSDWYL